MQLEEKGVLKAADLKMARKIVVSVTAKYLAPLFAEVKDDKGRTWCFYGEVPATAKLYTKPLIVMQGLIKKITACPIDFYTQYAFTTISETMWSAFASPIRSWIDQYRVKRIMATRKSPSFAKKILVGGAALVLFGTAAAVDKRELCELICHEAGIRVWIFLNTYVKKHATNR